MSRTKWPESMPVLEGKDFCREAYTKGDKHCLIGWARTACRVKPSYNELVSVLKEEINKTSYSSCGTILSFNDDVRNPLKKLARVWNRTIARLGYVINNPEAKNLI